jgi:hypothetical protein
VPAVKPNVDIDHVGIYIQLFIGNPDRLLILRQHAGRYGQTSGDLRIENRKGPERREQAGHLHCFTDAWAIDTFAELFSAQFNVHYRKSLEKV